MAIKINGEIVNSKGKVKVRQDKKKPTFSLVGKNVWWIKEGTLWEGNVLSDKNWVAIVEAKSRHYSEAGNSPEEKEVDTKILSINKDVYEL